MDGEERERKLLEDQISRAKAQADAAELDEESQGLQKKEGEKITLSFNFGGPSTSSAPVSNPVTTSAAATDSASAAVTTSEDVDEEPTATDTRPEPNTHTISMGLPSSIASTTTPITFGTMPTRPAPTTNPLKRPAPMNVFKSAKIAKTDSSAESLSDLGKSHNTKGPGTISVVERLMKEDQARKNGARSSGPQGYGGHGPRRG